MYPYVGEIRLFAGTFAPSGWALCNGQLMSIQQNTALFSLLGVNYGGDGIRTFALPNLQGRAPMHWGNGEGLTTRGLGEVGGSENVTLLTPQMPAHNHIANAQTVPDKLEASNDIWANAGSGRGSFQNYSDKLDKPLNPTAIGVSGGSHPHNNMQPYVVMNYIIALEGVYPPRH